MHEDLLGYLLGALEPHEMRRVANWLRDDPAAREELAKIEQALKPLEDQYEPVEPPPSDLISRTLAQLPPLPPPSGSDSADDRAVGESSPADPIPADPVVVDLVPMQSNVDATKSSNMTWIDWASGFVAAAVLLGLLLPSLAQGRFEARRIACQDKFRQLGTALTQFVNHDPQNRLPGVAESGPEAFAGIYALRLNEVGLLPEPAIRWCPSVDRPDRSTGPVLDELVSIADLHTASVDQLRLIQRFIGGHYAYTLGVIDQNRLRPPRYESRSSFAVMSDAPMIGMSGDQFRAGGIGHSGFGINVLYEDGRVQFLTLPSLNSIPDHPLLNDRGRVEAGVNINDAALAPSWRPPFVNVRQR